MKIISWNCNGGFRKKYVFLKSIDWDIAVIQECENPDNNKEFKEDKDICDFLGNYKWISENKNKGLAVFAKNKNITLDNRYSNLSSEFCKYGDSIHHLKYFLPVKVNDFTIIACWCHLGDDYISRYIGQLWKYLYVNYHLIDSKTLFIGDFNANKIWDKDYGWMNFTNVNNMLNQKELYSFYHYITKEEFGKEQIPTFFLHKNKEKSYHIDYAYGDVNQLKEMKILEIPTKENKYLSDHAPLYINVHSV